MKGYKYITSPITVSHSRLKWRHDKGEMSTRTQIQQKLDVENNTSYNNTNKQLTILHELPQKTME